MKFANLLDAGSRCDMSKTAGTCQDILKRREALWTFVQVAGVEPTNNAAEVRFVGQKPDPLKVWGIGPKFKGGELENWTPVSV